MFVTLGRRDSIDFVVCKVQFRVVVRSSQVLLVVVSSGYATVFSSPEGKVTVDVLGSNIRTDLNLIFQWILHVPGFNRASRVCNPFVDR